LAYSSLKKKIILTLVKRIPKNDIVFHATCKEETSYIKSHFGTEVNSIEIPNYLSLPTLLSEKKSSYFLFVGRIHPIKGIDNLIRAFAQSQLFMDSNFTLKIAGDFNNPYGLSLVTLVEELELKNKVDFIGYVVGDKKQQLLAQAYFSFLPSYSENFGNVVMEALSQKTPVVASRGTPWSILEEYGAGFWVENSSKVLSGIIDEIIGMTKSEYEDYSNNAYLLVNEKYDIVKHVDAWIEQYKRLVK